MWYIIDDNLCLLYLSTSKREYGVLTTRCSKPSFPYKYKILISSWGVWLGVPNGKYRHQPGIWVGELWTCVDLNRKIMLSISTRTSMETSWNIDLKTSAASKFLSNDQNSLLVSTLGTLPSTATSTCSPKKRGHQVDAPGSRCSGWHGWCPSHPPAPVQSPSWLRSPCPKDSPALDRSGECSWWCDWTGPPAFGEWNQRWGSRKI